MNRLLLDELQRRRAYPSITLLINTIEGRPLGHEQHGAISRLLDEAGERLADDPEVGASERSELLDAIVSLITESRQDPATTALAICVSPEYRAVVRLGTPVRERVVIDDTFATRDLVADLNRTATYRALTVSDRKVRLLLGDPARAVEALNAEWPMIRDEDESSVAWSRRVAEQVRAELAGHPAPTIVAGVERSVRGVLGRDLVQPIGMIPGNHDRTAWSELHDVAWPIVDAWMLLDGDLAIDALDAARSAHRFTAGIDEIWPLATAGRIDLLVVEESYHLPVRIGPHHLEPVDDARPPGVVDDIVDETIESVLRHGGRAVVVADDRLAQLDRIAAVLRY
ncbi:MAG: hypothetical protein ACKO72_11835 [Actinomycetes bacterium]